MAVVAAGVVLTVLLVRNALLRPLEREVGHQLRVYGASVAAVSGEGDLVAATRSYLSSPDSQELRNLGYLLVLVTHAAAVSNATTALEQDPSVRAVLEGGAGFEAPRRLTASDGRAYLTAAVPLENGGQLVGVAVVGAPLLPLDQSVRRVFLVLVGMGLLGIVAAALGAWLLLGRLLAPVEAITRTAATFSRDDPARRIEYRGPPDEIGRLVETVNSMLDRVERSFREQQQFLSDASHELRTPLSIVQGHLEVLDGVEAPPPELVHDTHRVVLAELDRMNRLVAGLLTLARSGERGFLRPEPVELAPFLEGLFTSATTLGRRRWQLQPPPPGLTVSADPDRLTQILLNLLGNAVEHTAEGDRIGVGAEAVGEWVRLWVEDSGDGIPPQEQARVFQRFYSRGSKSGSGLGLSIAEALVRAHGGSLAVQSQVGEGACFSLHLPRSAPA